MSEEILIFCGQVHQNLFEQLASGPNGILFERVGQLITKARSQLQT